METKFKVLLIGLFIFLIATTVSFGLKETPTIQPSERNYQGELSLGLIPNVPSRVPFADDKLIGYAQTKSGDTFGLFESNHLETKDYKGIFAYRVN